MSDFPIGARIIVKRQGVKCFGVVKKVHSPTKIEVIWDGTGAETETIDPVKERAVIAGRKD